VKAYLAIKYHPDNCNRPRIEDISAALERCGFETVCIVRDVEKWGQARFSPQELMARTFAEIDASDVVIIELSEKGVGLGIEAGYAWARNIPVITIARQGAAISTTLQGISRQVFWYREPDELAGFFGRLELF
jgi:2'-deoxynucleoside 5'-phosphate N-hydrolase